MTLFHSACALVLGLFSLTLSFICSAAPHNTHGDYYISDTVLPLWEENIPNTRPSNEKEVVTNESIIRIAKVQTPTIEVFLPEKQIATGQAVVIFPGGGYQILAYDWEGQNIAKWLNTRGIAGIVVKYRLPSSQSIRVTHQAPLTDAKRAMQLTRFNAKKWNINPNNIGIMGFSAGGHLASTLGTAFDTPAHLPNVINDKQTSHLTINNISSRPDFMVLMYPVISMFEPDTHMGSRNSLLGKKPSDSLINQYSNHLHVTKHTPPTFILHANDDKAVPVENSLKMYNALKNNNVPVALHVFPKGGHGFAMSPKYKPLTQWPELLYQWLNALP